MLHNAAATKFLDVLKNDPSCARCMFLGAVTGGLPIGAFSSRCSSCRQPAAEWEDAAPGCDIWKHQKNLETE
jgi:hypothetical protein